MSKLVSTFATFAMVAASLAVAGVAVRREMVVRTGVASVTADISPPSYVKGWERLIALGTWIGDSAAAVRIVEFSDYECPFCRRFHERFLEVREQMGRDVALLVVQFPLAGHRFARPAVYAAECADRQGRWEQFHNLLFEKQDSLGLKPWISFARDAGIRDTLAFTNCVATTTHSGRVDSSVAAGVALNVRGTPTVLINGWRYTPTPYDSLLAIVQAIRDSGR